MNSSDEPGKLFVGGLSWETTQESLQQYFSRFGEVVDSVVMKNSETGRSRGFGFVTFKDPDCLNMVLSSGPHELDGRTIDPKSCNPRGASKVSTKKPGGGGGAGGGGGGSFKQKRDNNFPKVFLGGLPSVCTETDLRNFFSKYGKVVEVVIMYDQERKKSRGFGFLSFESDESIDRVCAEHYVNINGKQVECKRAEPREASRSRGGSAGGGGGSGGGGGGYQGGGPMPNNQWGAGPNMMAGPTGWGAGPMGGAPGAPAGPPGGGPMPNGMMAGYQGGWGAPQQQQGAYQGYGTNYQGWGTTPTGYTGYGGTGTQYPQQQGYGGYGFGGYGGFGATPAVPGGQQPPGVQGTNDPYNQTPGGPPGMPGTTAIQPPANTTAMGNYQQESSNYGPARGYGGAGAGGATGGGASGGGAGDMNSAASNPYGTGNQAAGQAQSYGAGSYNAASAGASAAGGQANRPAGYHPYRR